MDIGTVSSSLSLSLVVYRSALRRGRTRANCDVDECIGLRAATSTPVSNHSGCGRVAVTADDPTTTLLLLLLLAAAGSLHC
jgi:hypothetical protein